MNWRVFLWGLLATAYIVGGMSLRHSAQGDEKSIWSRYDEKFAHLPEVQRLANGGNIAANDSYVALAPAMHALYAAALNVTGVPAEQVPWPLQLFNLLLGLAVAAAAVTWLAVAVPQSPAWQRGLLAVLLAFSPYTVASALWLTSDNFGMALFFATGAALSNASHPMRIGLAAALSGFTVLIRHIYMPALIALPLWMVIARQPRRAVVIASLLAALCFSPFFMTWQGLTPKVFAGVHQTRLFTANIAALCVFVVYLFALVAPLLDWTKLRNPVTQSLPVSLGLLGSVLAFAACLLDTNALTHNPSRYQDGALLYLLSANLSALANPTWMAWSGALVVAGGFLIGVLTGLMWQNPAQRLAVGLIGLHLAALCFQERPYQRYFEGPVILLVFLGLSSWMRTKPIYAMPLLAVWLLQFSIYLKRLF